MADRDTDTDTNTDTDTDTGGARPGPGTGPGAGTAAAPGTPEPIRFFGTTWVHHDGGYGWRRAGVAAGALLASLLGAAVLGFGVQGVLDATSGPAMPFLAVGGLTVCTVLGFHHTWQSFVRRRAAGSDPDGAKGLYALGFVGILLAYFVRALVEAPGEGLHRTEHETAGRRA